RAAPRDALDLPAPDGPSMATTSPDPRSVSLSSARPAEVFTRATLPGHESVAVRVTHGLGAVTRADLRQHVVDVAFHRRLTDHEALGDLRVGQARRDERENLGLTRGQAVGKGGRGWPGGRPVRNRLDQVQLDGRVEGRLAAGHPVQGLLDLGR